MWRELYGIAAHSADKHGTTDAVAVAMSNNTEFAEALCCVYVHMIEEYARHNGHADLIREMVHGAVGW
jgi:hypothetical protein